MPYIGQWFVIGGVFLAIGLFVGIMTYFDYKIPNAVDKHPVRPDQVKKKIILAKD